MTDTDPIVVTGMGAVSPLGVGVDANWQALMAGRSGIVTNTRFDTTEFACKIAGLVPGKDQPDGFDPTAVIDPKDIKKMDLFIQYGLGAAAEALKPDARGTHQRCRASGSLSAQIGLQLRSARSPPAASARAVPRSGALRADRRRR